MRAEESKSFADQKATQVQSAPSLPRGFLDVPHTVYSQLLMPRPHPATACLSLQLSGFFRAPTIPADADKIDKWVPSGQAGVMLEKLTSLQAYFPTPPRDKLGRTPLFGFWISRYYSSEASGPAQWHAMTTMPMAQNWSYDSGLSHLWGQPFQKAVK